ncbi:MAG: hypothetical protein KDK90_06530 [Leptospiraceae bacterium]|nr:hypothetical protein [Leptospiraceae bacterium]
MKFKSLIFTLTAAVFLSFSSGCILTSGEDDSNYFNAKISDKSLMYLLQLLVGSNSNSSSSCSGSSDVIFQGTVKDSRDSSALANVQVQTNPASIVKVTNTSGEYVLDQSICDGSNYEVKFSKYGYFEKSITQKARSGKNEIGESLLEKDTTKFYFVTVRVIDSGNNLISGATVTFTADGAKQTDTTGADGTISLPIAKSQGSQAFSVVATGYKTGSAVYTYSSSTCSDILNFSSCAASSQVLTVTLQ